MNTKCNKELFIKKSINKFGKGAFDYSEVSYVNGYTPIKLICKEHGHFIIEPNKHLKIVGGCPMCSNKKRKKRKSISNDEFKQMCIKLHGDKYNLDKVKYTSMKNKIIVTCKIHGDFEICAYDFSHLRGCPKCGRLKKNRDVDSCKKENNTVSSNKEEFIQRAKLVHGGKYDYSKVEYINNKTKVCIICPKHGEFWQVPSSHLRGIGCIKCGIEKRSKTQTLTTEKFIKKAKEVHGDKYDYSKTIYNGCYEKVKMICPIHGEFEQAAYSHLNGHGCSKCMSEKNRKLILMTSDEFINKAKEIHYKENNDYSNVKYQGTKIPVEIVCEKGHHYMQMPNKHLSGHSCPYCCHNISNQENEIVEFIKGLGVEVQTNRRDILDNKKEIDIFIPSHNIAIEFDGLYWHNSSMKENNYHINKTNESEKNGIRLIHIFEDEWLFKKDIVKSRIKNILGKTSNKIYARNCIIREISYQVSKDFLETNHIQGPSVSSIRYGLYYKNELVAIMTFGGLRKNLGKKNLENTYELLRFCNKLDTIVIGGADKLLSYFIKEYKPNEIVSYADRRWSQGKLYEKLNFKLYNISSPNYFYVIGQQRFNRFNFRKDRLVKDGFDSNKTEKQIMEERGIPRIYDCGCLCYKWINDEING